MGRHTRHSPPPQRQNKPACTRPVRDAPRERACRCARSRTDRGTSSWVRRPTRWCFEAGGRSRVSGLVDPGASTAERSEERQVGSGSERSWPTCTGVMSEVAVAIAGFCATLPLPLSAAPPPPQHLPAATAACCVRGLAVSHTPRRWTRTGESRRPSCGPAGFLTRIPKPHRTQALRIPRSQEHGNSETQTMQELRSPGTPLQVGQWTLAHVWTERSMTHQPLLAHTLA